MEARLVMGDEVLVFEEITRYGLGTFFLLSLLIIMANTIYYFAKKLFK